MLTYFNNNTYTYKEVKLINDMNTINIDPSTAYAVADDSTGLLIGVVVVVFPTSTGLLVILWILPLSSHARLVVFFSQKKW